MAYALRLRLQRCVSCSLRLMNVRFVVNKMALGQNFFLVIRPFPVGIISQTLQTHSFITEAV